MRTLHQRRRGYRQFAASRVAGRISIYFHKQCHLSFVRLASRYTLGNEYILHNSQWLDPKMRKSIIYNMLKNLGDTLGIASIKMRRATRIRSLQLNLPTVRHLQKGVLAQQIRLTACAGSWVQRGIRLSASHVHNMEARSACSGASLVHDLHIVSS
jgi:hypothetical protein